MPTRSRSPPARNGPAAALHFANGWCFPTSAKTPPCRCSRIPLHVSLLCMCLFSSPLSSVHDDPWSHRPSRAVFTARRLSGPTPYPCFRAARAGRFPCDPSTARRCGAREAANCDIPFRLSRSSRPRRGVRDTLEEKRAEQVARSLVVVRVSSNTNGVRQQECVCGDSRHDLNPQHVLQRGLVILWRGGAWPTPCDGRAKA